MINEFHNRNFTCSNFVPAGGFYNGVNPNQRVCFAVGSTPGSDIANGDAYINSAFQYYHAHKWCNFGVIIGFMIILMITYLIAAELVQAKKSKGEVLVFQRGHIPTIAKSTPDDTEAATGRPAFIEKQMTKEGRVEPSRGRSPSSTGKTSVMTSRSREIRKDFWTMLTVGSSQAL